VLDGCAAQAARRDLPGGRPPLTDTSLARESLRQELSNLQEEIEAARRSASDEAAAAAEWQRRALVALRAYRDDLAREALQREQAHRAAEAVFRHEMSCLAAVRDLCEEHLVEGTPGIAPPGGA
jgi:phage shock protein A